MIIGTLLVPPKTGNLDVFTPWFPRGADNAVFSYEIIHNDIGSSLTVTTYHKDGEDAGSAPGSPTISTFSQLASTGIYESKPTGLKEMIRFKVTVPSGSGLALFRFFPPTWYDTAQV